MNTYLYEVYGRYSFEANKNGRKVLDFNHFVDELEKRMRMYEGEVTSTNDLIMELAIQLGGS